MPLSNLGFQINLDTESGLGKHSSPGRLNLSIRCTRTSHLNVLLYFCISTLFPFNVRDWCSLLNEKVRHSAHGFSICTRHPCLSYISHLISCIVRNYPQWPSGNALGSESRGIGFDSHRAHFSDDKKQNQNFTSTLYVHTSERPTRYTLHLPPESWIPLKFTGFR